MNRHVMLVDDEPLARKHIRSSFPWDEWGYEIVCEADNGAEALEQCRRHAPDIALVDITMPVMDGLTLLERMAREHPRIRCIVLTAHRDFAYIQKALQLGAVGYILKSPIHPEETRQALDRASAALQQDTVYTEAARERRLLLQTNRYPLRRSMLEQMLSGVLERREHVLERGAAIGVALEADAYIVVAAAIDQPEEVLGRYPEKDHPLIEFSLLEIVRESLAAVMPGRFELFPAAIGRLAIVLKQSAAPGSDALEDLPALAEAALQQPLADYMKLQLCLAASPCMRPEQLGAAYRRSAALLVHRFYQSRPHLILEQSAAPFQDVSDELLSGLAAKLQDSVAVYTADRYADWTAQTRNYLLLVRPQPEKVRRWFGGLRRCYPPEEELHLPPWPDFESCADLYACFETLARWTEAWQEARSSMIAIRPEIARAVAFIRANLSRELTLDTIAGEVGLSASHLSHLFKREIGSPVIDYVLEQRIEQAKVYIAEGKYRNYELAEKVGFRYYSHFSTMFKKMVGCSPSDYKKTALTKITKS
ncbi:response regulator [Paenibacillus sp. IB182496]|uniref:Response regulator n=1 Tax=Paenibacillus sabuli TaxID=2772509 RepID=A0A927GTH8_9BACL|nr:response regulator [Paenibacillus sabuli]MBD2847593.1 response regulator [Paenibacillus sabuli]